MSRIWQSTTIAWTRPETWVNPLSRWLRPYLNANGIRSLRRLPRPDLAIDDSEWLHVAETVLTADYESVCDDLAHDLTTGKVRAFHGCRTDDASAYHRDGLLRNDPDQLERQLRRMVDSVEGLERHRKTLDAKLVAFNDRERDIGRVFFALDERSLIKGSGHYLLYGSEWMQCILGWDAHAALRRWGAPTLVTVDIPTGEIHEGVVRELAKTLLHEWARFKTSPPKAPQKLNFGFSLQRDVPPDWIAGHSHPSRVWCPFDVGVFYDSPRTTCAACE